MFAAVDAHGFVRVKPDELKWQLSTSNTSPDIALLYGDPRRKGSTCCERGSTPA